MLLLVYYEGLAAGWRSCQGAAAAAGSLCLAESFHPSYPQCKVRRQQPGAAFQDKLSWRWETHLLPEPHSSSGSSGSSGTSGGNKGVLPPLHEHTHRGPGRAGSCGSVSPHWRSRRKDIAGGRNGSVGAVHQGKDKCTQPVSMRATYG